MSTLAGNIICPLCPHRCVLPPNVTGFCRARKNVDGQVVDLNYGRITSIALDPIEKKPFMRFHPGRMILSIGSFGCNLRCPFCQNASISQRGPEIARMELTPEQLLALALKYKDIADNLGVAFTYNEPLISYEYVLDCARLLKERDLAVVLVTNGTINQGPWETLLPYVDAANIDLKGFTEAYYKWLGGDLETVKTAIAKAVEKGCHVEVTTLVIPGRNDRVEDMDAEARWLASLSPELPLHISRYFPRWQLTTPATPVDKVLELKAVAEKYLKYVYTGNC